MIEKINGITGINNLLKNKKEHRINMLFNL